MSWMRRDLKRFAVELLCLLVLLYGDPLQAISQAASARLEVTSEAPPAEPPPAGESDSRRDVAAAVGEAAGGMWVAARDQAAAVGSDLAGQPWLDALSILLSMASFQPQGRADSVPPMPRVEDTPLDNPLGSYDESLRNEIKLLLNLNE